MRAKVLVLVLGVVALCAPGAAQAAPPPDVEQRIGALVAQMTLAEKLGQLQQLDGLADGTARPEHARLVRRGRLGSTLNVRGAAATNALQRVAVEQSRLKIPHLFAFDVIHGYRTIFPVPLGEAASWDPPGAEDAARIAAREATAAGVRWTFAPMADIARDPRWGRVVEGAGEDPYLGAAFAAARTRGFQGDDPSAPDRMLATAKHWAGYGAAEAGRDYNDVDLSERELREVYLPPFKAARDAGVGSFMTAFNTLNGVPATGNPYLLRSILRDEWGFDGVVVSDYTAVLELIKHGMAADEVDAARIALMAGTDVEMVSRTFNEHGQALLRAGAITLARIDEAVANVLRAKYRAGLFERPYVDPARERRELLRPAHRRAARRAAARSMVLLRNADGALPLRRTLGRVAVVGPLARARKSLMGTWWGDGRPQDVTSVLEGVQRAVSSGTEVSSADGCDVPCTSTRGFGEAVAAARAADTTVVVVGESYDLSGEAASRSSLDLPGRQLDLVKAIARTGKPYVVVLMNGRPLTVEWLARNAPGLLEAWFPGTEGGPAVADVLFGRVNPGGKLPITFPRSVGQIPIHYDARPTGRPFDKANKYTSKYLDSPNTPLYRFGHGLSYTTFALSNLRLGATTIAPTGSVTASVTVRNTGRRTGDEVVQLYVRDRVASVSQPLRRLRDFRRVTLRPGGSRRVTFSLEPEDLAIYDADMKPVVEPGRFVITAATDSRGGLRAGLTVAPG
jgi:beta-glucosidase